MNIDAMKKLLAEATPQPWSVRFFDGDHGSPTIEHDRGGDNTKPYCPIAYICEIYRHARPSDPPSSTAAANAILIVAAVNGLPGLIDRIEQVLAERDKLRSALEKIVEIGWRRRNYDTVSAIVREGLQAPAAHPSLDMREYADRLLEGPK